MLEWLRTGKRTDRQQGNGEWAEYLTEVDSNRSQGDPGGTGRAVQVSSNLSGGADRAVQISSNLSGGAGRATQAMADLATEAWRFSRVAERCAMNMDIMDADRFLNQYDWFARKIQAVTQEAGLWTVDLTGQVYEPGMAVSPLNLEDFPEGTPLVIAQMVEPVLMENGNVRKMGTAMLDFRPEEDDDV